MQYVKVEVPEAAAKLRTLIALAGDDLPGPFDGEESITLLPDLDAGANGHHAQRSAARLARANRATRISRATETRRSRCTSARCR